MIIISKVYFRYGTMDSSKTARLLMDAHEYAQRGEFALLIKPSTDTRSKKGKITSRIGLQANCIDANERCNIFDLVKNMEYRPECILIDEAQFLTEMQVVNLRMIANVLRIPVMCYGLKSDFRGRLFEGAKALFEHADKLEEVKTICREEGCKNKAMYNGRFIDGKPVFEGEIVAVGETNKNNEGEREYYYVPKCSLHFFSDIAKYHNGAEEA
ncbi:thymidine kinase [Bacillus velezensis]|uniref:thymidine kinase n=1 Tax=Bacillus velezensis TaxID=492670 RepID=UPI001EF931F3|nr:thymidine kinase [Bacillus velezensis]